jgi:predicted MPP superfamily phosphohydrolase
MFHTIVTLSYTIPALYLFIRIWQLFVEKRHRLKFILLYVVLISIYPISLFVEDNGSSFAAMMEKVSGYLLPFYMYFFLLLLLTDILLLINLIFRIIPRDKLKERPFRNRLLITLFSLSFLILVAGIINFNTIRITNYKVEVKGKKTGIEHLKIAFVSDFHLNVKTPKRYVRDYVSKINEVDPDIMLYGGDIIEGSGEGTRMSYFENLLRKISPVYRSYAILGNHDHIRNNDRENFFNRADIILLRDSIAFPGGSFAVAGRRDIREGRMKVEDLVNSVPENTPLIILDHRPVENELISKTKADLVLSGHTHHGQLFPINLITSKIYELSYGYMKKRNTHFIVSSGLRLWGPPVRTIARSEIVVIDVTFK